ncbi:MAG: hypothetical protein JKY52_20060 [Flavobacteriales bacterium]|nr:hypothetical protein [Flavobacteriales bacterium]
MIIKKFIIVVGIFILILFFSFATYKLTVGRSPAQGDNLAGVKEHAQQEKESRLTTGSPLGGYANHITSAIIRMVLGGTPLEKVRFNRPEEFSTLDDSKLGVFHPDGGGAIVFDRPVGMMASGEIGRWIHNGEFEIEGLDRDDIAGNSEIIAFNIGVKKEACELLNKYHKINNIPRLRSDQSSLYTKRMIDDGVNDYVLPTGRQPTLNHPIVAAKTSGCFQSFDGQHYIIFTGVLER